jgi:hypothetical protein
VKREKARSKLERQQRKAEKLRLEKAERKVQEATSESKLKRENGDEGDGKPLRSTANNGTDLSLPTPLNFLRRISKADNYDIQTCTLGNYLFVTSMPNRLRALYRMRTIRRRP